VSVRPQHIFIAIALGGWILLGAYSTRYIAGGLFLLTHKSDPTTVEANTWGSYWQDYKNDPKQKKKLQGSMAVPLILFAGVPIGLFLASLNKKRSLHGDAKWATRAEIENAGLLDDSGIILGKLGNRYLMTAADKFALLIAPTRSGKGVGTIIPNLLNWSQSVIAVDIKGTLFNVTSGFRARHGQQVFKFAPFDEKFQTHRFNPLSYVSRDPLFVVGELQSIGYMLYPHGDGHTSSFFNDAARNYFVAVSLYCIESDLTLTMGEILRRSASASTKVVHETLQIKDIPNHDISATELQTEPSKSPDSNGSLKETWQKIINGGVSLSGKKLSQDCIGALQRFLTGSDNTLANVLASFNAPLGIFANTVIDAATSSDDFDLRDIRRKRMSIYVVIPPNRLDEASLLTNLFFSVLIDQNTKTLPSEDPSLKHLALLVLDEFAALGRVNKFVKAVGYMAEYGLRALTVAQSVSQLQSRNLYGDEDARTLVSNHMLQIMYSPREVKESQEYSELLGYTTERGVSRGTSSGRGTSSTSENVSDQKRALMLPQELRDMSSDRVIIQSDNCKPIFADKIRYYSDPVFMSRLFKPLQVPSLDLDSFMAQRKRIILADDASQISDTTLLKADPSAMPTITDKSFPIPAEVIAVSNYLFNCVQWIDTENSDLSEMSQIEDSQQVKEFA
jgi:type IV secretion system protein VirD4